MAPTPAVLSDIEAQALVVAGPTSSAAGPEETPAAIGNSSVAVPDGELGSVAVPDGEVGPDDETESAGFSALETDVAGTDNASAAVPEPSSMPAGPSSVAGPDAQSLAVRDPTSTAGLDVARPDESGCELVTCSMCGSLVLVSEATIINKGRINEKCRPVYRCKVCNKVHMVLYREMKKDAALKSRFVALSKEQKGEWLRLHRDEFKTMTGCAVTKACREHLTVVSTSRQEAVEVASFTTSLKWMDEADVKKHFEDKPLAASEVLKNAKSFVCTTTKRKLYGVPEYSAGSEEKAETRTTNCTTIVADADVVPEKPKKMPRTACRESISMNHDHIPS